jgi:hypothetical protein
MLDNADYDNGSHHVDDEHDGGHDDRQVTGQGYDGEAAHA